jgi:CspA family cold shock protein
MKGTVKFFNSVKGFGFIKTTEKDIFFHKNELLKGEVLKEGDTVEFNTEETSRGSAGTDVRKIS